jgi:hypothetical protein
MAAMDQAGRLISTVHLAFVLSDPLAAGTSFQNQFFLLNDYHQVASAADGLALPLIYEDEGKRALTVPACLLNTYSRLAVNFLFSLKLF